MAAAIEIPDLWGDEIKVTVLSPLVILKVQAEMLNQKTRGLLLASVESTTHQSSNGAKNKVIVEHSLLIRSPAINYTEVMMLVSHEANKPYPVVIIMQEAIEWAFNSESKARNCNSEREFIAMLKVALQSPPIRSAIESMLALSNEQRSGLVPPNAEITPPST